MIFVLMLTRLSYAKTVARGLDWRGGGQEGVRAENFLIHGEGVILGGGIKSRTEVCNRQSRVFSQLLRTLGAR